MLGLRTAFGGGQGPNIGKQVVIILGVWIVAKSCINRNTPPPAGTGVALYSRPKMIVH